MDTLIAGITSGTYEDIRDQLVTRLKDISEMDKDELTDEVDEMMDAINSDTNATISLYKIMAIVPDVYFRTADTTVELVQKLAYTLEVLEVLQDILSDET
jgi:hypothetical protein